MEKGKEKNSAGAAKVSEPKKEKRRRLVLSSESETDDYVPSFPAKVDEARTGEEEKCGVREERETKVEVTRPRFDDVQRKAEEATSGTAAGGTRTGEEEEKCGVKEERETKVEITRPRFDNVQRKEKLFQPWFEKKRSEAGDVQLFRKKMRLDSVDSIRNQTEKVGASSDADVRRTKAKSEHVGNHIERTGFSNKMFDYAKHRDKGVNGVKKLMEGSIIPGTAAKQRDVDNSKLKKCISIQIRAAGQKLKA
ncbi:hypothetical protein KSP40_PGU016825 [Platanthera guangdongensis]|uniref:Uncharacterized protein n=1 Tax=Platanthera guangdongensis TaxID=2320717 RepID=A0ABR2MH91_9ASPA